MDRELKPADESASTDIASPSVSQVYEFLVYGLSLPERAVRTTSALVGGAVHESAALLVPQAFRDSKSYDVFVRQMLEFVVRDVGGVETPTTEGSAEVEGYVARKTVGSFIDLAGLATLHLSPLTVLAIASDVAYGSKAYLQELSDELKQAGVIDANTTIDHAADLLDAVGKTSAVTADAFDTPPISLEGLKETISQTEQAVRKLDPASLLPRAEMEQIWTDMHEIATRDEVTLLDVSGAMSLFAIGKVGTLGQGALSTAKVTGNMFDRHILDHYRQGLADIQDRGFYATYAEVSRPYIAAVWQNFSGQKPTLTEGLVSGRLIRRAWTAIRRWLWPSSIKPGQ